MKDKTEDERFRQQAAEMNQELMLSLVRQHELTEELEKLNAELQTEIPERKKTEEALRQSEERLKKAQEIAHLGSWELDLATNRLSWSDEVYRLFGLKPQEFTATYDAFLEAVHPEDRASVDAAYSGSLKEGRDSYEIEHRVIRKSDGAVRVVHEKCEHVRDESGRIIRSVGMVHDITERKRSEEALRESEAQFRTFADAIPTLCWMANADGWIFWYNKRWYEYTGTTPEQMEGWGWQSVHDPETLPKVLEQWKATIASENPFEMVFPLKSADGIFRPFLTRVMPVRDTDGNVVRWFGTNTDISEQKRSEDELEKLVRERTAELGLSNAYNRSLIEASLDPLVTIGPDGKITDVNTASEKVTGRTRDELIGTDFSDYFTKPEEARAGYEQVFREGYVIDYPLEVRHRDGRVTPVLYNASVYRDDAGNVIGVFAAARDITERKLAEEEALRMQKLESLRVLAGGIAHDLNNMMVAVEANAGLALKALGKDSPASEYLISIENAADKVSAFSKQILSFTGKAEVKKKPVQMNDVVEETAHFLMASISKTAEIEYSLSDGLPAIMADPQNMQQIVMNLIINASDAIGDSKGTIRVSTEKIRADRKYLDSLHPARLPEGDYVYVEVSDTGSGMSPEIRMKIFEPFYTTKFTGRGLGLSAVFGIVSAHGGAIGLESAEGRGTTFRVLLPVPAKPVEVAATEKPVSEAVWSGKGTILLVDDEESALKLAKKVLESAKYTVLTAADGSEAIEVFREKAGSISAVIMDLIMPHVRGDEAAKEIRKIKDDINILLVSGYHEIDLTELKRGPGKTALLEKPYRIDKFLGAVQDILKA